MDYRYSVDFAVRLNLWDEAKNAISSFWFPKGEPLLTKHADRDGWAYATFSSDHSYDIGKVTLDLLPEPSKILGFSGFDVE